MKVDTWDHSPTKIEFGADMVITDVGIDKDHTLTLFTEQKMIDQYNFYVIILPRVLEEEKQ